MIIKKNLLRYNCWCRSYPSLPSHFRSTENIIFSVVTCPMPSNLCFDRMIYISYLILVVFFISIHVSGVLTALFLYFHPIHLDKVAALSYGKQINVALYIIIKFHPHCKDQTKEETTCSFPEKRPLPLQSELMRSRWEMKHFSISESHKSYFSVEQQELSSDMPSTATLYRSHPYPLFPLLAGIRVFPRLCLIVVVDLKSTGQFDRSNGK